MELPAEGTEVGVIPMGDSVGGAETETEKGADDGGGGGGAGTPTVTVGVGRMAAPREGAGKILREEEVAMAPPEAARVVAGMLAAGGLNTKRFEFGEIRSMYELGMVHKIDREESKRKRDSSE